MDLSESTSTPEMIIMSVAQVLTAEQERQEQERLNDIRLAAAMRRGAGF